MIDSFWKLLLASIFSSSLAIALVALVQISQSTERKWILEDRDRDRGDGTGEDQDHEDDPLFLPSANVQNGNGNSRMFLNIKFLLRQIGINLKRRSTRASLLCIIGIIVSLLILIISMFNIILISAVIAGLSIGSFLIFLPHQQLETF